MACKNHPEVDDSFGCSQCGGAFCADCAAEGREEAICKGCVSQDEGDEKGHSEEAAVPCALAKRSLAYAIFSLFCVGFVLGPLAILRALEAREQIRENPHMTGKKKTTVALIIATLAILLWIGGIALSVIKASSNSEGG